jgi:hypothetical protein
MHQRVGLHSHLRLHVTAYTWPAQRAQVTESSILKIMHGCGLLSAWMPAPPCLHATKIPRDMP